MLEYPYGHWYWVNQYPDGTQKQAAGQIVRPLWFLECILGFERRRRGTLWVAESGEEVLSGFTSLET